MISGRMEIGGANILVRQNDERRHLLLAASSATYGNAKTILAVQIAGTVGGAMLASILSAKWPAMRSWTVLYAVIVSLLDTFVLERIQAKYRKLAAQIQELFDGELFGLPWNVYAAGEPPTAEDIIERGDSYLLKRPDPVSLKDWYPAEIALLPVSYACLVCQRINCWWDERLRKRYLYGLITVLVLLIAGVTAGSLARQLSLEQFFLSVLAPLWPALAWGTREVFKQHDAAESTSKLRTRVEKLWQSCLKDPLPEDALRLELRTIQTEVFRGRVNRPLVFNWVHRLVRSKHQKLMQSGAAEMVASLRGSGDRS